MKQIKGATSIVNRTNAALRGGSGIKKQNMKELIAEARSRIEEIAKKTHNCLRGHETAIYVSENGYTISYLRRGHETRTDTITFGSYPMTKKEVEKIIDHMEELDEARTEDMRYNANIPY